MMLLCCLWSSRSTRNGAVGLAAFQLWAALWKRTKNSLCCCAQLKQQDANLPGKQGFKFTCSWANEKCYPVCLGGWKCLGDFWVCGWFLVFCFSALTTEIYFTLECQDSLGCAGSLNEPSVLGVKHALFELELQFFCSVCFSCPSRFGLPLRSCPVPGPLLNSSLSFFTSPLWSCFTSSLLVTFHHHSLLIPNLILTCLRMMKMLAEPHSKDWFILGLSQDWKLNNSRNLSCATHVPFKCWIFCLPVLQLNILGMFFFW